MFLLHIRHSLQALSQYSWATPQQSSIPFANVRKNWKKPLKKKEIEIVLNFVVSEKNKNISSLECVACVGLRSAKTRYIIGQNNGNVSALCELLFLRCCLFTSHGQQRNSFVHNQRPS